jgi:hypothetical protein
LWLHLSESERPKLRGSDVVTADRVVERLGRFFAIAGLKRSSAPVGRILRKDGIAVSRRFATLTRS